MALNFQPVLTVLLLCFLGGHYSHDLQAGLEGPTSPAGNQNNVLVFHVFSGPLCKKGRQTRERATSGSSVLWGTTYRVSSERARAWYPLPGWGSCNAEFNAEGEKGLGRLSFSSRRLVIARIAPRWKVRVKECHTIGKDFAGIYWTEEP